MAGWLCWFLLPASGSKLFCLCEPVFLFLQRKIITLAPPSSQVCSEALRRWGAGKHFEVYDENNCSFQKECVCLRNNYHYQPRQDCHTMEKSQILCKGRNVCLLLQAPSASCWLGRGPNSQPQGLWFCPLFSGRNECAVLCPPCAWGRQQLLCRATVPGGW